ncbi:cationic peroxidase 2-like [Nymphaea colorata]|nr:cationic peroxidase 2-like [Nymphaea colorata]
MENVCEKEIIGRDSGRVCNERDECGGAGRRNLPFTPSDFVDSQVLSDGHELHPVDLLGHLSKPLFNGCRGHHSFLLSQFLLCDSWGALQVGFYASTCPSAESIVASTVQSSVNADKTIAASLLHLHFHDCFVQGCDGSILIDGPNAEKRSGPHAGVRGYELIEGVKSQLEQTCPGVVSRSDIVAMAARDAIALSGGPRYEVETGRRYGRVSAISDASIMPDVDDPIDVLKSKFATKGLSAADLVLLSGGKKKLYLH